jgi:hypothetical protein
MSAIVRVCVKMPYLLSCFYTLLLQKIENEALREAVHITFLRIHGM